MEKSKEYLEGYKQALMDSNASLRERLQDAPAEVVYETSRAAMEIVSREMKNYAR